MDDSFRSAVLIFAHLIGIDIENEAPLLQIAEEALVKLPDGWLLGYGEGDHENVPFFFNELTEESVWHHPNEAMYISRVTAERQKLKAKTKQNNYAPKKEESMVEVMDVEDFDDFDDSPVKAKQPSITKKGSEHSGPAKETVSTAAVAEDVKQLSGNEKSGAGNKDTSIPLAKGQKEIPPTKTGRDNVKSNNNAKDNVKSWNNNGSNNSAHTSKDPDMEREEAKQRLVNKANDERRQRERDQEVRREADRREADRRDTDRRNKEMQREADDRKREAERREADRRREEKERALEDERDRATKGALLSSKEAASKYENLQLKLRDLQQRYKKDCEALEAQLDKMDTRLKEEKRERKSLEERLISTEEDLDRQVKDEEEHVEARAREAARRARIEAEDESKEKLRGVEKRQEIDMLELRGELSSAKRRVEDLQREVDLQKQRALSSREDARMEAVADVEELHKRSLQMEELLHAEQRELRKVRGDHAALTGKLTSALQLLQLAKAERDAAQAEAQTAVSEGQINHVALLQATKRMQQLDTEVAKYRAEAAMLRKEAESLSFELRKAKDASALNSAMLASSVSEGKGAVEKIETNHYISRISELEVVNSMLSAQANSIDIRESTAVRQIKLELDKALSDLSAFKKKAMELESQMEGDVSKISNLQKEISSLNNSLQRKEQKISEQQLRLDAERRQASETKNKLQFELEEAQREMYAEKAERASESRKHAADMENLRAEVSLKIPQIASSAVENAEKQWMHRLAKECDNLKQGYELHQRRLNQDMIDQREMAMEREAQFQSIQGKDRSEIGRLRQQNDTLRKENESYRLEVSDYRDAANNSRSRLSSRDPNMSSYDGGQAARDNDMMLTLQSNLNSMRAQLSDSLIISRRDLSPGATVLGELDALKRENSRTDNIADDVSFAPNDPAANSFRSASLTPKAAQQSVEGAGSRSIDSAARFDLGLPYDFSRSFGAAMAPKAQDFSFPDSMVGSGMHEGLWRFKYLSN